VQPPIGTLPPDRVAASEARLRVARPDEYCIDPRAPRTTAEGEEINLPVCPPERLAQAGAQGVAPASQVPLTEGRDLGAPTLWNVWAEGSVLGISDERFGLDMETTVGTGTFGIDRRLSDDVVLGVSFSVQNSSTEGFGDFLQVDANGFTVGPYVAVRLSPHWAMDASLTYGQYDNDIELAILGGDYTSRTYGRTEWRRDPHCRPVAGDPFGLVGHPARRGADAAQQLGSDRSHRRLSQLRPKRIGYLGRQAARVIWILRPDSILPNVMAAGAS
jgi:hypothetical protein